MNAKTPHGLGQAAIAFAIALLANGSAMAGTLTYTFQQGIAGYAGFSDTTIFNESDNAGGGTNAIFVGRNMMGPIRRALIKADLASLPPGSMVTNVRLELSVNNAPNTLPPLEYSLHKLTADWGEGSTVGTMGGGGQGGPAANGDATWTSNFFNVSNWTSPGGDFVATASATADSGAAGTITSWSSPQMVSDVQSWVDDPASNFGWIIIGPETTIQRLRRFDSSEAPVLQPKLIVQVTFPGLPTVGHIGLTATAVSLLVAGIIFANCYRTRRQAR